MKRLHPPSFLIGLGCSVALLVIFFGAKAVLAPEQVLPTQRTFQRDNAQFAPSRAGLQNGTKRLAQMAENFGMTVEELQGELESGKTMMEIAEEHGVEMPFVGRGPRSGTGIMMGGSGSMTPPPRMEEQQPEASNDSPPQ